MKPKRWIPLILFSLVLLLCDSGPAQSSGLAPAAPLPQPTNISCQGFERDTVTIRWKDTASDETNYRVEVSVNGGGWTQLASVSPDANGKYSGYADKGITVTQNRRYRVRSYRSSDNSYSPYSSVCNNRRIYESSNFRIFYGILGTSDDCPLIDGNQVCLANVSSGGTNVYVTRTGNAFQGSVDAFSRLGFTEDATKLGSLDRFPVNVVWCDGGGCSGGGGIGAAPSLLETAFDVSTRVGDPVAWLMPLHEMFHSLQFKYWGIKDPYHNWVVEGQARSIQDKICIGSNRNTAECFDDIATGNGGYVPEVIGYLSNPNRTIIMASYDTALFWTYLTEQYGTSSPSDQVEAGMNLIRRFWEDSKANPGRDGVTILNSTLAALGHSVKFRDVWKDFAVANYAKGLSGPNVPDKYKYDDMAQTGGNYGSVALAISQNLNLGGSVLDPDETVYAWGARYYEVRPAADVPMINITITQDTANNLYYTILGIKNNDIAYEYNTESRNLVRSVNNNSYDRVAIIVAGLENLANYRVSINGTQPTLRILEPTTANKARVGDPNSPDKFRVVVEVLTASGTPLTGVNLSNFSFKVGNQNVSASNILASATVMGQHWFVLRAPTQSTSGMYDLEVKYSTTLTGTQSQAVNYIPRTAADNLLLIDRSGSMSGSKLDAAKATARLFVDSWHTGDKIGVISFSDNPLVDLTLRDWTDGGGGGSRQEAFNAINALTASGWTNIGDTLRSGWTELQTRGNNAHDWALVLLSDGKEEGPTPTETFDQMIWRLQNATTKRPMVHTVAVGPDADRVRMQRLASVTGGTYHYVSTPSPLITSSGEAIITDMQLNLDYRYRMIATDIVGLQPFFATVGPLGDPDPYEDVIDIPIDGSAAELVLSLSGQDIGFEGMLYDPMGAPVQEYLVEPRHFIWRVSNPQGGIWQLHVYAGDMPYLVQASLRSDVTMEAYLTTPLKDRVPGVPMPILVTLTDIGPITGAWVVAYVEIPSGGVIPVQLYDDGGHGDGVSDDGLYGGTFYNTGEGGSYNVSVIGEGVSQVSGDYFVRQRILSFHLDSVGDGDGDGLPDEWEIRNGTDPDFPDADGDPDVDGLPNIVEKEIGTHPNDPDSDDGGESDGTDPNPRDPGDDAVTPTWAAAYPGIGRVILKYAVRPEYVVVGIFRSDGPDLPFDLIDMDPWVSGVYTDTGVTNGVRYCYLVMGQDSDGRQSAALMPTCATPSEDPYPPHGWVMINDGAPSTMSQEVMLTLWASDEVDPDLIAPGDEALLPPADSASGVVEMMISNQGDFPEGAWEPYGTQKPWVLDQSQGLAAVFVKYRDALGNESPVYVATIYVRSGPGIQVQFLPIIRR